MKIKHRVTRTVLIVLDKEQEYEALRSALYNGVASGEMLKEHEEIARNLIDSIVANA